MTHDYCEQCHKEIISQGSTYCGACQSAEFEKSDQRIATLKAELATSKKVIEVLAGTTASRLRPKEWWIEWAEERVKTESHAVMHSAEEIDKIFSQF